MYYEEQAMTKTPLIVVDIDGVLFNTPADAVMASNAAHGTAHDVTDIFDHDAVHDKTKFVVGGVDQFYTHQLDAVNYSQVAGARAALQRLRQKGARIVALTSRNPEMFRDVTVAAIDSHFGIGEGDDKLIQGVLFAGNPVVGQHRKKGEMIKELGGDILVDDAVRHCQDAERYGVPAILLAQPYNAAGHDWPPEKRAASWAEAEQLIEQQLGLATTASSAPPATPAE